ncbi:MAG TPA: hypothetical protein VK462_08550 [Nitrososphaeraceae archaeon]|nr:hypothetical protein [Nitrososphaeraceae archaeon]
MKLIPFAVFLSLALFLISSCPAISYSTVSAQLPNASEPAITPEGGALLKKILSASSFSNIQIISFVNGIEASGVNIGDSDITLTLKQTTTGSNESNTSTPVTVTAVRVPGSSIKDLLTLIEASSKLKGGESTGPLAAMLSQMGGMLSGSNASDSTAPLQALMQLGRNTQIGVGNIVGGDWKSPRTVTTGLVDMGQLFGMEGNPSPDARAHFIMVFVVPYVGKTNIGSVPLK